MHKQYKAHILLKRKTEQRVKLGCNKYKYNKTTVQTKHV